VQEVGLGQVDLGFNGIWNSEEDLRLLFVCFFGFVLFVWKALGQTGSVD